MLQLDKVVLEVMAELRAKTVTKNLITIMIKATEIIIVPLVVIKTIVATAAMIILGVTMATLDMDRNMQTAAAHKALNWQGHSRGQQSPKQLLAMLKEDIEEKTGGEC